MSQLLMKKGSYAKKKWGPFLIILMFWIRCIADITLWMFTLLEYAKCLRIRSRRLSAANRVWSFHFLKKHTAYADPTFVLWRSTYKAMILSMCITSMFKTSKLTWCQQRFQKWFDENIWTSFLLGSYFLQVFLNGWTHTFLNNRLQEFFYYVLADILPNF